MLLTKLSRFAFFSALVVISWLAVTPSNDPVITTGWDKSNHFLAFFVLLLLLDHAYPAFHLIKTKLLILFAFALIIECVQSQLPWRSFSLWDIVADAVGLLLYIAVKPLLSPRSLSKLFTKTA